MSLLDDLDRMSQEYNRGERNFFDLVVGSLNRGVAQPIGEATSAVIPDAIEDAIGQGMLAIGDATGIAEAFRNLDPVTQRRITETAGAASVFPMFRGAGAVGAKAGQAALPNQVKLPSTGQTRASGDVIIEGFYSPSPLAKGLSVANFGVQGLKDVVKNVLDPRKTAMYKDYGLTNKAVEYAKKARQAELDYIGFSEGKNVSKFTKEAAKAAGKKPSEMTQKEVKLYLDKRERTALETFQSQLQTVSNIRAQSGSPEARVTDFPKRASERASAIEGKTFFTKKDVGEDWYNSTANIDVEAPEQGSVIPQERANRFQQIIETTWENADNLDTENSLLFVKRPAGKYTGDHVRDTNFGTIPKALQDTFKGANDSFVPFLDKDSLKLALNKQKNKLAKKKAGVNFNIVGEDADGFFVQYSKAGVGKTEGGINIVSHVDMKGIVTSVVSDKHDIATPKALKPLGDYLDYSMQHELTVTPPIVKSLYNKDGKMAQRNINNKGGMSIGEISAEAQTVANLKPTRATLADETYTKTGVGMLGLSGVLAEDEEQ